MCIFVARDRFWLMMTVLVATPGLAYVYYYASKRDKIAKDQPRPDFVPYSHLRLRTKVVSMNKF